MAQKTRLVPFDGDIKGGIEIGDTSQLNLIGITLKVPRSWILAMILQEYGQDDPIKVASKLLPDSTPSSPGNEIVTIENVTLYLGTTGFFNPESTSYPETGMSLKREELLKHFPKLESVLPTGTPITLIVDLPKF
jgi:hypothetical protein